MKTNSYEEVLSAMERLTLKQKEVFNLVFKESLEKDILVRLSTALKVALETAKEDEDDGLARMSSFLLIEKDDASTPAKPSERRHGSSRNKPNSASGSGKVTFSESVTQGLKNKVKEHNESSSKKVTLEQLKAVYRRGAGAFSTSHRPNMTRGQWAMARVNSFLKRVKGTGGHKEDDDLIKKSEFHSYDLENYVSYITKESKPKYTKDKHGNIVYHGEKFAGFNKPMRDGNGKQGKVLVKEGDRIKKVRFGDPKMPDNTSVEQNDRFYDRFGHQKGMNDKFSPLYWSSRWLWPRGSMKGKGTKPFYKLKGGSVSKSLPVIKELNDEEMIAIEPMYTTPDTADAHEDGMSETEIRKMVDNANKNIKKIRGNIQHTMDTDGFHFLKFWVNETECYIGGNLVPEGIPIAKVQFTDPKLWELRKNGTLRGLSIGALGERVPNEDYEEVDG